MVYNTNSTVAASNCSKIYWYIIYTYICKSQKTYLDLQIFRESDWRAVDVRTSCSAT